MLDNRNTRFENAGIRRPIWLELPADRNDNDSNRGRKSRNEKKVIDGDLKHSTSQPV